MKIFAAMSNEGRAGSPLPADQLHDSGAHGVTRPTSGFTMVEIAISLAIIGIALVGILAVLPSGLNVQRDNREGTIINQDSTVFMEAIRNGSRGDNDLTNYVYAITNYWALYLASGSPSSSGVNGYNYFGSSTTPAFPINSGTNIISLLSTPKYQDVNTGLPLPNLFNGGYSNHIVAYVHSMSGPAVEKPPQDNALVVGDSFGYRIICDNVPVETDPDAPSSYATNLTANLHELRLTFLWPQRANGSLGGGHQTFRTLIAGQLVQTNEAGNTLYFFQSQSFTTNAL
jgi:prepilin-type N-terminal cleavage/methylation domain-containing protein